MHSKKPSERPTEWTHYLPPAGLVLAVVLFGLTQSILFALCALALLAYLLYVEFKATQNWKELLMSVAVALGAWILLSLLLNTTSPINIITSCSMLPGFERGDLIILQGASSIQVPVASVPYTLSKATDVPAEITSGGQRIGQIFQPTVDGKAIFQPGFATCTRQPLDHIKPASNQVCLNGIQTTDNNGKTTTTPILQSPDVVVYDSNTSAGLIIHRAFAILNGTDGSYVMTKGDNNNFLDQQSGFYLIPDHTAGRVLLNIPFLGVLSLNNDDGHVQWLTENQIPIKGKVLLRVPYIGYIKLLLFLQIQAPAGCDSTLGKPA